MQIKIVICCQIYLYAEGLRQLLEEDEDILILGIANNDEELNKLIEFEPDIVLVDDMSCKMVLNSWPHHNEKKVLLVNGVSRVGSDRLKDMISAGLGGVLPKNANAKVLRKAIRRLDEGELWIERQTMREVFTYEDESATSSIHLTKKEEEILDLVCNGLSNREISKKLFISEQTVKSHFNHLFKKFGVSSRLQLALNAPKCLSQNEHGLNS